MNRQFLIECLNDWQQKRNEIVKKINRYEKGDRPALLAYIYERGDLHKTLASINEKINTITKQLGTA